MFTLVNSLRVQLKAMVKIVSANLILKFYYHRKNEDIDLIEVIKKDIQAEVLAGTSILRFDLDFEGFGEAIAFDMASGRLIQPANDLFKFWNFELIRLNNSNENILYGSLVKLVAGHDPVLFKMVGRHKGIILSNEYLETPT